MSVTTESPISRVSAAENSAIIHYRHIIRHRLAVMAVLVVAIVASLLLD
ncbi:iron ABC transporter permease, partial [Pectobacterium versatile]|nr:iron ABC transporter permease [Pectobacterium versatile]